MRIGIDLGGTKITAILMDSEGREIRHLNQPTHQGCYKKGLMQLQDMVHSIAADHPYAPVGIGIPGALSPATGLVKNANSTWLIGHGFDQDLEAHINRPVRIANDADCFTLSEATDGAGRGFESVFGVILGTGVGGGFAIKGQLLSGPNAICGEWGHNPLPWATEHDPPHDCYCGKAGCIETCLSGPGLQAHHQELTGESVDTRTIVAAATPGRRRSLELYADRLARALSHVINIIDPHIIVLGGGLSQVDYWYRSVPALWHKYIFSDSVATALAQNRHGPDSGVRGAAWLWSAQEASLL